MSAKTITKSGLEEARVAHLRQDSSQQMPATSPTPPSTQTGDSALDNARVHRRNRFGQFEDENPAIFRTVKVWGPANHYCLWKALIFRNDRECKAVLRFIKGVGTLQFVPYEILLSTLFLPKEAAGAILYRLGDGVGGSQTYLRAPKETLPIDEKPEVHDVYHINGIIPELRDFLGPKGLKPHWFEAKRRMPNRTKSFSKTFLDRISFEALVADLIRTEKSLLPWFMIANEKM